MAVETPEYRKMLERMIKAHGRRVADADPEDLAEMIELREILEQAIASAVTGQKDAGRSWAEIGRGLGTSRQAAQMRYARCSCGRLAIAGGHEDCQVSA